MGKTRLVVLKEFFGYQPQQTMKEFSAELGQLSEDEKDELARLAAQALGVELEVRPLGAGA